MTLIDFHATFRSFTGLLSFYWHVLLRSSIKTRDELHSSSVVKMSTSWKYGDVSTARYPFPGEKEEKKKNKKEPTKRSRANKKQDVFCEAAEPPAKIYKKARQRAAPRRR